MALRPIILPPHAEPMADHRNWFEALGRVIGLQQPAGSGGKPGRFLVLRGWHDSSMVVMSFPVTLPLARSFR